MRFIYECVCVRVCVCICVYVCVCVCMCMVCALFLIQDDYFIVYYLNLKHAACGLAVRLTRIVYHLSVAPLPV